MQSFAARGLHSGVVGVLGLLLALVPLLAAADDTVKLRLRWVPQFQFAGYYMALEKGFYREAGLDVQIIPSAPELSGPIDYVLTGQAEFGIANSGLVRERAAGKPVVALAAIGQHAPAVWLVRGDSGIQSLHDLVGKRLMSIPSGLSESIELFAPFVLEGIDLDKLTLLPTSYDLKSLVNGETDALNAYITNEPFVLLKQNVDFRVIRPRSYGVDFYSDILFTTEAYVAQHPERVKAFREASLKGWRYALTHVDESIDVLLDKYVTDRSREHLQFEADSLRELIDPDVIAVGHMNPGRWQHIAQLHQKMGLIKGPLDWQRFLYQPEAAGAKPVDYRLLLSVLALALLAGVIAFWYRHLNARLRHEIIERTKMEQQLRQLATTDWLSGLNNRGHFFARASDEFERANRYIRPLGLMLLDIDWFKQVNDRYGHQVGDAAIQAIGEVFNVVLRHSDIAGRVGGEEFAVLLPETEPEVAAQVAERIREAVAQCEITTSQAEPCRITISIGLTAFASSDDVFDQMYSRADKALYAAKANGRDQIQLSL
ncbi:GGDEF domain-containing protein [Atopomonas sediminilitoris]|uniref:GGDEF domain-containing protein n=1 Tax=Atopomonas sediminilitoris TaxID=2919919 RepID=UPI001F4EF39A|nr:GGDEF domain-containing protein [Atopomonas sediminilitoris]MCJ8168740.1 GGDEF domain-containing protein [Atopomonas sediminilitoris]